MDVGPITRPAPSNVSTASRHVSVAPIAPVAMQMISTAVAQASAAPKPRPEPPPRQPDKPEHQGQSLSDPAAVDRRIKIDPATQQVIYQAIDKESGEVVRQVPEETMLRLQVYARALREADSLGSDVEFRV